MSTIPSMVDMLKAGVHFGHKNSKWHPNSAPHIFTTKNNVHIIDLEKTHEQLQKAAEVAKDMAAQGKTILFVGTKRQAAPLVEKYAITCNMPYVSSRWLGGTLTNYKHVSQVARTLTKLKKQRDAGELDKYTKKEQLEISRDIEKKELMVGGMEEMMKLPDMLFIVDIAKETTALAEAQQMGIPVMAVCDTNTNPRDVEYPIAGNDDATKSIELILATIADAINEGASNAAPAKAETMTEAAEKAAATAK